jgi:intracellular multiplication protein IcmG
MRTYTPSISYAYRLQAAIPGRAWLMRSDGANVTVSLGDKIPGYGTIVGIDPNEGVVQTSSGANIKYRTR